MKAICIGGGPAALYFGILARKAFPDAEVSIYERNRPDDTFGWGVVFSRETLGNLQQADPESYEEIRARFAYWDDIDTFYRGTKVTSTGHGFCGLMRKELLQVLQERCRRLGVTLEFQRDVKSLDELPRADLVVAADGVHSFVREALQAQLGPHLDWRKNKFCWLGTDLPLRAFTFVFKEHEAGLFRVHAYPFQKNLSTWIVECREDTWRKAGLDRASEAETVAFCERLFREELRGHELLANKSVWRTFPTIHCERWSHGNVVLLGDAVHTAHFSIGSGTKLAMEDAIALVEALKHEGTRDVPRALAAYEAARRPEVIRTQKAAQTSLEWFENTERYLEQEPLPFAFNLMTRSKRITYDNLKSRDPALVGAVDEWFAARAGSRRNSDGSLPPPAFAPFTLRSLTLRNRLVVSPMCQYSATDGTVDDWHLVHLGSRAIGGAGLVIAEATGVSAQGRITPGCAGMYRPEHAAAWQRVVEFIHAHSQAYVGLQLGHAGRKASCSRPWEGDRPLRPDEGAWETVGPSAVPYGPGWHTPRELDRAQMSQIVSEFVQATRWAKQAGFDLLELHAAHGYLLSSFMSPLSNRRNDGYGGPLANRLRFPLEVFDAMRAAWPAEKPMSVRISATDWLGPEGLTGDDAVQVALAFKAHGADLIDVSTAGNVPESRPEYGRMYQVPFADQIRHEAKVPVMAVGAILGADHANTVVAAGRADLCAIARGHLRDPYLTLHAAETYGVDTHPWPDQYLPARPKPRRPQP